MGAVLSAASPRCRRCPLNSFMLTSKPITSVHRKGERGNGGQRSRARMSRCLRKQLSVQFGASPATLKYSSNLDIYCRYHSFTTGMKHKIYLRLLNLSFRVSSIAWHKFSAVRVMNSPVPKSSTCYRDPKCIAVRYTTHIPLVTEATMFR